ncbi:MAG: autoinducer binding domain-containing protein [Paracoccaceae bacterium]
MRKRGMIEAEVAELAPIANAGYFLALRLRGASPMMTFSTFPTAWTDAYMENGYLMRDPVTTWALTIGGAIRWSSPFLPDPFGIFREAAKHGLKFGASVATGPVGSLTLCSMARGDRDLADEEVAMAKRIVTKLHEMTAVPKALSGGQKELLAAAGAGKLPKDEGGQAELDALCEELCATSPDEALRRARENKLL